MRIGSRSSLAEGYCCDLAAKSLCGARFGIPESINKNKGRHLTDDMRTSDRTIKCDGGIWPGIQITIIENICLFPGEMVRGKGRAGPP